MGSTRSLRGLLVVASLAVAIVAALLWTPYIRSSPMFSSWTWSSSKAFAAVASFLSRRDYSTPAATTGMAKKTPVYFFSHGGPTVQYNTEHPVYPVLQEIGREITQKVKPKAVVVFSAHWQAKPNSIRVNQAEHTDLIYDFYGFPDHYYKAKYPNRGSPQLASHVLDLLSQAGIKAEGVSRGLDHGVWAGFHVAFHPEENPLNVPLVQVSLYHSEDPDAHYRLGKAVAPLREEGVVIIGAGMSVHNLRELVFDGEPMPYSVSFDNALKEAAEAPPSERQKKMAEICRRPDAKQAHPWMDHLMPIHVAAGAAGDDAGKQTWTMQEGSFGWAQYRFGEVPSSQL